jgi:hypothetical protein
MLAQAAQEAELGLQKAQARRAVASELSELRALIAEANAPGPGAGAVGVGEPSAASKAADAEATPATRQPQADGELLTTAKVEMMVAAALEAREASLRAQLEEQYEEERVAVAERDRARAETAATVTELLTAQAIEDALAARIHEEEQQRLHFERGQLAQAAMAASGPASAQNLTQPIVQRPAGTQAAAARVTSIVVALDLVIGLGRDFAGRAFACRVNWICSGLMPTCESSSLAATAPPAAAAAAAAAVRTTDSGEHAVFRSAMPTELAIPQPAPAAGTQSQNGGFAGSTRCLGWTDGQKRRLDMVPVQAATFLVLEVLEVQPGAELQAHGDERQQPRTRRASVMSIVDDDDNDGSDTGRGGGGAGGSNQGKVVAWTALRLFGRPKLPKHAGASSRAEIGARISERGNQEPSGEATATAGAASSVPDLVLRSGRMRLPLVAGAAPADATKVSKAALQSAVLLPGASLHFAVADTKASDRLSEAHPDQASRAQQLTDTAWVYRDVLRMVPLLEFTNGASDALGSLRPGEAAARRAGPSPETAARQQDAPSSDARDRWVRAAAAVVPEQLPASSSVSQSRHQARRASAAFAASAAATAAMSELETSHTRRGSESTVPAPGPLTESGLLSKLAPVAEPGIPEPLLPTGMPSVIEPLTADDDPPWIAASMPRAARLTFGPDDGFDVYVDRAVFCPDNLGVSKVVFKAMDDSYNVVGDPMEKSAGLDCSLIRPEFNAYAAFRPGVAVHTSPQAQTAAGAALFMADDTPATMHDQHGAQSRRRGGFSSSPVPGAASGLNPADDPETGAPSDWDWNPTLTMVFRVDGLDAHTHKLHAAGYAVLNVFTTDAPDLDERGFPRHTGSTQPNAATPRSRWRLNAGAFQIPLHMGPPDRRNQPMSGTVLEDSNINRVPCATLLVRIVKVPKASQLPSLARSPEDPLVLAGMCLDRASVEPRAWVATGLDVPAPEYAAGQYDSTRCVPREAEVRVYPRRSLLDAPTLRQAISLFAAEKEDGSPIKGLEDIPSTDAGEAELEAWLDTKLDDLPLSMLDFRYICPYVRSDGFSVCIDGVSNSPPNQIVRVACCPIAGARESVPPLLQPEAAAESSSLRRAGHPAAADNDSSGVIPLETGAAASAPSWIEVGEQARHRVPESESDDATFGPATPWYVCKSTNWLSPRTLQAFTDDFVTFHEEFEPTTCMLFQVFAGEVFAGGHSLQLEQVGWGVMPVFDKRGEGYTRRGAFVVPVLAGKKTPDWLIERLRADPGGIDRLVHELVAGTTSERDAPRPLLVPPGEPVSILVRIQDGQFQSMIPVPTTKYSTSLAPKPVRTRFKLSSRMAFHKEQLRLAASLPRSLAPADAEELLVRSVRSVIQGRAPSNGVFTVRRAGPGAATAATVAAARDAAIGAVRATNALGGHARRAADAGQTRPQQSDLDDMRQSQSRRVEEQVVRHLPEDRAGAEMASGPAQVVPQQASPFGGAQSQQDAAQYGIRDYASSISDSYGPEDSIPDDGGPRAAAAAAPTGATRPVAAPSVVVQSPPSHVPQQRAVPNAHEPTPAAPSAHRVRNTSRRGMHTATRQQTS